MIDNICVPSQSMVFYSKLYHHVDHVNRSPNGDALPAVPDSEVLSSVESDLDLVLMEFDPNLRDDAVEFFEALELNFCSGSTGSSGSTSGYIEQNTVYAHQNVVVNVNAAVNVDAVVLGSDGGGIGGPGSGAGDDGSAPGGGK